MTDQQPTHFILVPGFWLGAWAWDRVGEELRRSGHLVTALTLPGLESVEADRSQVTMADHADAVLKAIGQTAVVPVLVAHSGAGAVASVVLDREPSSVRRVVYVDSGPASDGWAQDPGLSKDEVELPLPAWDVIRESGTSLDGLSINDLEEFSRRAVPHPARIVREPVELTNDGRLLVPTTLIACSIPSDVVRELASDGHPMFAGVAQLTDLTFLDVPTGHWPMFSKPGELAEALIQAAIGSPVGF
jgi:pimeloyl-ACP methyl ester carboxylesterase